MLEVGALVIFTMVVALVRHWDVRRPLFWIFCVTGALVLVRHRWGVSLVTYGGFLGIHLGLIRLYRKYPVRFVSHLLWVWPLLGLIYEKNYHCTSWIGMSYLALKMIYLALELPRLKDDFPTLSEVASFYFFFPTLMMGPIYRLRDFRNGVRKKIVLQWDQWTRVTWGIFQCYWISESLVPLTYSSYLLDGYQHGIGDFLLSSFASLFELYFRFNGFMDIVLGLCAFLGWQLPENFNEPFYSRNMKEFWNRWHISLNLFMRDVVFMPLSKFFIKRWNWGMNLSLSFSFLVTFILTGIWHGFRLNFFLYGLYHGVGLIVLHFWTVLLKKRGVDLKAYEENVAFRWAARSVTLLFMAVSMFFFKNNMVKIGEIIRVFRER
jgi:D-alanyl-lipoteichoic acid acyltransferase DltB (MBOAT superfamily)